jgi:hypothetical protein
MHQFSFLLDGPAAAHNRLHIGGLGDYSRLPLRGVLAHPDDVDSCGRSTSHTCPVAERSSTSPFRVTACRAAAEAAGWRTDIDWDGDTPCRRGGMDVGGRAGDRRHEVLFIRGVFLLAKE